MTMPTVCQNIRNGLITSAGDKLSAVCSKKQFRRVKDLYDLYYIIEECNISFDELHQCIIARKVDFGPEFSLFRYEAIEQWRHAWSKFRITPTGNRTPEKPSIEELLQTLAVFLQGYMAIEAAGYLGQDVKWWFDEGVWH